MLATSSKHSIHGDDDDLYTMLFMVRDRLRSVALHAPNGPGRIPDLKSCHVVASEILRDDLPDLRLNLRSIVGRLDEIAMGRTLDERRVATREANRCVLDAFVTLSTIEDHATLVRYETEKGA